MRYKAPPGTTHHEPRNDNSIIFGTANRTSGHRQKKSTVLIGTKSHFNKVLEFKKTTAGAGLG